MVRTACAEEGMVLALPILHPNKPDLTLLRPGARLDRQTIDRLIELRIHSVWIRYPSMDFMAGYTSHRVITRHARLTAEIWDSFNRVIEGAHANLRYDAYAGAVRSLINGLVDEPKAALFLYEIVDADRPLLARSANICFLSLLMGLKLDHYLIGERRQVSAYRARNVENLGLGAMLADIGMLRIDRRAALRWEQTHDESDPRWREHVIAGYELVQGRIPPTAAAAVLHHHQRYDGSGFPRRADELGRLVGRSGSGIHIFSRIIAVADLYERLRNPARPGQDHDPPVPNVRVLGQLLEEARRGRIDPVVYQALLEVVPAFAPGSMIKLNDGSAVVVSAWDPTQPCRPQVCRLAACHLDGDDARVLEQVDLRSCPDLAVVEAEGQPVEEDLFVPDAKVPGGYVFQEDEPPLSMSGDGAAPIWAA